jgi:TolA-binding protein
MSNIEWRKNIEEACEEIRGGTRLLLLAFYASEDCEGSRKTMEEVFTDQSVSRLVERTTAPVKYDVLESKDMAGRYRIDMTPTFVIADDKGMELERWVGFLPPQEFGEQLMLSKGLAAFHLQRYKEAIREFEEIVSDHPSSELAPEAEFFLGIAGYKDSGDTEILAEACDILKTNYPGSLWTKKCSAFSHLTRAPQTSYIQGGSLGSGVY